MKMMKKYALYGETNRKGETLDACRGLEDLLLSIAH